MFLNPFLPMPFLSKIRFLVLLFVVWGLALAFAQDDDFFQRAETRYAEQKGVIDETLEKSTKGVMLDYALALDGLRQRAQDAGALDPLLEIQREVEALSNLKRIGESVNEGSIAPLRQLVTTHRPKLAAVEKTAQESLSALNTSYVRLLKAKIGELTKEGKIEAAIAIRDRVAVIEEAAPAGVVGGAEPVEAGVAVPAEADVGVWAEVPVMNKDLTDFIKEKIGQPGLHIRVEARDGVFRKLNLGRCELSTLDVLAGCPAEQVEIFDVEGLKSLDALRTFPNLEHLSLRDSMEDVDGLRGLKVQRLTAYGLRQDQLAVVAGLPLEHLGLSLRNAPEPISALMRLPLRSLTLQDGALGANWPQVIQRLPKLSKLTLHNVDLKDLTFLRARRLEELSITKSDELKDLSPLAGMPLTSLSLVGSSEVFDLRPLAGMPLRYLGIANTKVDNRSLPLLVSLPLERLNADGLTLDWPSLYLRTDIRHISGAPKDMRKKLEQLRRERARK